MAAESEKDVVIIYDASDLELVNYLSTALKKQDINCWYLPPERNFKADGITERAEAVVNAKVLLVVLSEVGVQNQTLKDEIALAYISNSSIIPIGRNYFKHIASHMDSGMKLMLAKINWIFFTKEQHYEERMTGLTEAIISELQESGDTPGESEEEPDETLNIHMKDGNSVRPELQGDTGEDDEPEDFDPSGLMSSGGMSLDFWDRHFGQRTEATWIEFKEKFLADYSEKIVNHFGQDKEKWAIHLIYKDIFELHKTVDKSKYTKFCGKNLRGDPHLFFKRLKDYAVGSFAMRAVFDMDSTVRLTAIQNLGRFQTAAVISALFTLVADGDPNIRAVAALALAKTGKNAMSPNRARSNEFTSDLILRNRTKKIEDCLIKLMNDEDRLVRESACLSLGHMKSTRGIPHIVNLWRNDAIKHVREAAELALSRIGGDEAERAMKVTQVLSSEMANLRSLPAK